MSNKEEIEKLLFDNKLYPIGEITTKSNKVLCTNEEGYKVFVVPKSISTRGDTPLPFHKRNPNTLDNIKLWLIKNGHGTEYISGEYENSQSKLEFKCGSCNKSFSTTWCQMIGGKIYCNHCAKSKRFDGLKDYYSIILAECEKYDYELISEKIPRSNGDFQYICRKHKERGPQTSSYDSMINAGKHCQQCGLERGGLTRRKPESHFKKLVEDKGYIYCGVDYENAGKKCKKANIHIMCPNHIDKGEQIVSEHNFRKQSGCGYCVGRNQSQEDVQNELDKRGGNIDIVSYINYASSARVRCRKCGYEWCSMPVSLKFGHFRCPKHNQSKFEKAIGSVLDVIGCKDYIIEHKFDDCRDINPLPFDFYSPSLNLAIEADGEGHYKPIRRKSDMTDHDAAMSLLEVQRRDKIKTEYCSKNNITLMRIPYWKQDVLYQYISTTINNATKDG